MKIHFGITGDIGGATNTCHSVKTKMVFMRTWGIDSVSNNRERGNKNEFCRTEGIGGATNIHHIENENDFQ